MGFDLGALFRKIGGDQSADVITGTDFGAGTRSDPNAKGGSLGGGGVGGGGGGGGGGGWAPTPAAPVAPPSTQLTASIAPQAPAGPTAGQLAGPNAALAQLDGILANKNAQSQGEYQKAIDGYNSQDAIDRGQHDESVAKNETTLTNNNHSALINAINAGSGLRSVLSSLGALGGSGLNVVNDLVGKALNSDTGTSKNTFDTNATSLNQAWQSADQAQKTRRADAQSTLANNQQNNEASVLTSKQSILNQLAGLFGSGDARGNDYATQAASLAAPIAQTTRASIAPYQAASSLYSPGALQNYLAGTQNLQTNVAGSDTAPVAPINAPGYGSTKKDQLTGVA